MCSVTRSICCEPNARMGPTPISWVYDYIPIWWRAVDCELRLEVGRTGYRVQRRAVQRAAEKVALVRPMRHTDEIRRRHSKLVLLPA